MLPEPQPVPTLPLIEVPTEASARLIVIPPGCPAPQPERAVFVGTVVASDLQTARFQVDQVRSGRLDGYAVGGLVDVRYGDEVRFLELDEQYIVGAGVDGESGVLSSRVSPPAPLFAGNDVVGVDDPDVDCPVVQDPVRTLTTEATSVESGVLSPLAGAKGDLLLAVLQPAAVALAVLVVLVLLKHLVFALGRTARDLGRPRSQTPPRSWAAVEGDPGDWDSATVVEAAPLRPARRPPGPRRLGR